LEERRGDFVESAVRACEELRLKYVISQHPADKGDLSHFNVGSESIYDLLTQGSILISRFSTTILEALAMGRPVVYHNPIDERVPKFMQPLGAFSKSRSVDTLKRAITHELGLVAQGVDIRQRASLFLHLHCNTATDYEPAALAADAIAEVVTAGHPRFDFKRTAAAGVVLPPAHPAKLAWSQMLIPAAPATLTAESSRFLTYTRPARIPRPTAPADSDPLLAETSLAMANELTRSMQLEKAIKVYVELFRQRPPAQRENDPLSRIYEFNALLAARKLGLQNMKSADSLLQHLERKTAPDPQSAPLAAGSTPTSAVRPGARTDG
jgi:hypothetical protein